MSATIKPDLRDRIAGLSAITSAGASVGVDRNPQNTSLPRVVVSRIGYRDMDDLTGPDDSLLFENFEIDCYGKTSLQAESMATAICNDLESLSGDIGSTRSVVSVQITDQTDDYSESEFAGDAGTHIVQVATEIQHIPQ